MNFKMKPRTKRLKLNKAQRNIMYYVLKPHQIEILKLKMKGHTYKEIAEMKGITTSGMYRFIARAVKTINKAYLRYNMSKKKRTPKKSDEKSI